jgi:hypothetical protein
MNRKRALLCIAVLSLVGAALPAADLAITMQVNLTGKDYANNSLSFKGNIASVDKDQFAPGADATSGASKLHSTEVFNAYRFDVKGKPTLPSGLRYMLLYAVANDSVRSGDNLTVSRGADGGLIIRYVHRGTAFEITTDAAGVVTLPSATAVKRRVIGFTDNTIGTDFSPTGKVTDVNWKKVWDTSIADGKQVGTTAGKTGKVTPDVAESDIFVWQGAYQFAVSGPFLKITASLDAQKK